MLWAGSTQRQCQSQLWMHQGVVQRLKASVAFVATPHDLLHILTSVSKPALHVLPLKIVQKTARATSQAISVSTILFPGHCFRDAHSVALKYEHKSERVWSRQMFLCIWDASMYISSSIPALDRFDPVWRSRESRLFLD